jgi:hypothetical protein
LIPAESIKRFARDSDGLFVAIRPAILPPRGGAGILIVADSIKRFPGVLERQFRISAVGAPPPGV